MFWLIAVLIQVPVPTPQPPADPPVILLERIRRGLQKDAAPLDAPAREWPVFRMTIRETPQLPAILWQERTMRPGYVKTRQPIGLYEFLQNVTPEDFRAATLHPIGIDVLGVLRLFAKGMARDTKTRAERRAKEQVARELRELLAQRPPPK